MKTRLSLTFLLILPLAVFFESCKKPGCVGSAGQVITQERLIPAFSKIELSDNIDLVLIQSDTNRIEITGPQNILPNVQTNVLGDLLSISNETECRWLRDAGEKISVRLFFRNFVNFEYKGNGNVTNEDTLRMDALWFNSETGAGVIDLNVDVARLGAILLKENASMIFHGNAGHCETYTNARGILDLSDLRVRKMYIIYSGLADTHINVSDTIEAQVRYRGNVYCKGNPAVISQEYYSSGRLILTP